MGGGSATVLNVNDGRNATIMDACGALRGYARFVAKVRAYEPGRGLERAVSDAVDECIAEGVLADYFRERKAEVADMFMTEYDAERQRLLDREEGRAGMLFELVADGLLSEEEAAAKLGVDEELFSEMLAQAVVRPSRGSPPSWWTRCCSSRVPSRYPPFRFRLQQLLIVDYDQLVCE